MITTEQAYAALRDMPRLDVAERQQAKALIKEYLEQKAQEAFVKEMTSVFSAPCAPDGPPHE